jgi:DNA-binding SARP family transcriptional activator/predicted Zn-dependent protease/TolB-like protein
VIRLHILGPLDLRDGGGAELRAVLAQPKRLALLAYLAVEGAGGFIRRDTLLAAFWPESDEERARGAFRQAVRYLRRSLGPEAVVNRGTDEVGIHPEALWCDAAAFQAALTAGDPTSALDLYRGDLLDGLHVHDAPGFQDWLEATRTALRTRAADAARALADTHEAAGNLAEAVRWARRTLELAPFDEATVRHLVALLDRSGDRAGAVATFEAFARTLDRELDLDPSPESVALLERVRERTGDGIGHGDLPPPLPHLAVSLPTGDGASPLPPAPLPPAVPRPSRWRPAVWGLALVVLSGLALWGVRPGTPATVQPVMVVPFTNHTGDAALDPLGAMATDWITQGVAQTGAFEVVPARAVLSARRYVDGADERPDDPGRLRALVRETGARALITGAYYRQRDSLYFHARITRARDGRVLVTIEPVAVPADAPLDGVDAVRHRVLAALAPLDGTPTHARAAIPPPSYGAYRAYVAGMEAFIGRDIRGALALFERAAGSDDAYPMPRLSMAIMHMNLGDYAAADSVARQVEPLRGRLGPMEAATLDMVRAWLRSDDAAAYDAVVRQARIAPGSIAHYQVAEQARRLNRPREALRVLREFDPERSELRGAHVYWREMTAAHHMLGEHRRALRAARRGRALYPDLPVLIAYEVRALAALGRTAKIEAAITARLASPTPGYPSPGELMLLAADGHHARGDGASAEDLYARAAAWHLARPEADGASPEARYATLQALYAAGRYPEAERIAQALAAESPEDPTPLGYLGLLAARRGDRKRALAADELLAALALPYRPFFATYWRVAIATALGDHDDAMTLLQGAFRQGMPHGPWHRTDRHLAPLRDRPEFAALLRPRG